MIETRGRLQLTELGRFEITLAGQVVPYMLRRSHKARLVWLNVRRQTGLTVTIPRSYSQGKVAEFLLSNSRWIVKNLVRYCATAANAQSVAPEASVPYLGRELMVTQKTSLNGADTISLEQDALVISLAPDHPLAGPDELHDWLKHQAKQVINQKAQAFSLQLGLAYNRVAVKEHRSRWGSCSHRRNLNFNWRLIMAPEPVLDYVVIHELCHLREMSHSKKFWSLVASYCPDWSGHRSWLDEHCSELNARFKFD